MVVDLGEAVNSQYRVVIIGGGVVGASVAYHLAKLGWTDVAIVERSILTAGSSWHAAGGFHALNADPNIAALQAYTIDLLSEVSAESGQDIGMHMAGGITFASAPERWEWLQATYRIYQTMGIEDCWLMTPDEIEEKCPIINTEGVFGGLWADREGYIDPSAVVHAYAKAARQRGADVIEHNRVIEMRPRSDRTWDVVTEHGTIHAEHVVNAAGLWAKQVGRMVGWEAPLSPLEHHYLITEQIPEIEALGFEMPMMIDLEGFTYMRQEINGLLVGIYEVDHKHWSMDGAPWDYGVELLRPDVDRISDELALAMTRYPVLERTGINRWVNGAFTFSPDGNPLVGPVPGLANYWSACAVMAGFLQGGGVGKSLAEWMVQGEPEEDIFGMDVARFGSYAQSREYIKEMTGQFYSRRFVMTYRTAVGGSTAAGDARLRRHDPSRGPLGCSLRARGSHLFRASGLRRDADPEAIQRIRPGGGGMSSGPLRGGDHRHSGVLEIRGDRPQGGGVARQPDVGQASRAGPDQAVTDARSRRASQGGPDHAQLG
jgi:dimethylglycine dehydrogenase